MIATGADYCDFVSYYPGVKPLIVRVEKDEAIEKEFLNRLNDVIKEAKLLMDVYNEYEVD
jgi:hypothetical protein